ncbi:hypothetical protein PFDG_02074 [Plasmodium falciparum Dd2]|uniref:Rifin n=1 Tax=Plasmodium falciparum (isolate Dd2) TaxID=57267 RepID=A0A0L7M1L9_PLAF4|nr:hypothetical protein PFDG_02074 [Plasmodium falciparum Dd2]
MKVHYISILLFTILLNILLLSSQVYNQRNYYITPRHTETNRSLCECELYAPANYDSDTEMKRVMENFSKQTQQRFHEYDERMKTTRQKCREQCDKEIQKIILKDKLEKQMEQQLTTLETKIDTNDIPTCVCEKSMADKVEKGCLRCGGILSTAFPEFGLIGGTLVYSAAVNAATKIGMKAALGGLESVNGLSALLQENIKYLVTATNFRCPDALLRTIDTITTPVCNSKQRITPLYCSIKSGKNTMTFSDIKIKISNAAESAASASDVAKAEVLNATFTWETFFSSPLGISLLVTVCIIIILSIIYLILRYRRKKKMKKKLQYIKLLEE